MKSLNKILPFALLCVGLSSCLNEEDPLTDRDTEASPNIIEFYSEDPSESPSAEHIYAEFIRTFEVVPEDTFDVTISYSGKDNAPEDIVVDVMVDEGALQAFNAKLIADAREAAMAGIEDPEEAEEAANEAEAAVVVYDLMPTNLYSLSSNQVTIKKGERRATLKVMVKPELFDFAFRYGLPLTINSASTGTISGNFRTVIFSIGAKNQYDGIYSSVAGNVQRFTAPGVPTPTTDALNGSMAGNPDVILSTVGTNTVEIINLRWAGGTSGIAGIDNLRATIDPATNEVTMSALGNASLRNIASAVNKYDPATRTFTLNFEWNPTGATRQVTGLVLEYERAR